ncbi:VWA domain-containing protein [Thiocystis violacea]|uniref:VWA domain-containing protein n=1 Tax=Thiocystis violacea TaxID=13725 RepID=UPI001908E859|nr:VWA domain-containing protein [Thiocystis violacea]MBK1724593.1 tellurium resistance protein [Thiocystis violacea]
MHLNRGQRLPLSDLGPGTRFHVRIELRGLRADPSCFGLDANGRLADERYMVFFNQPESPCRGLRLSSSTDSVSAFDLALDRLPRTIERLVFVAAIDGQGSMRQLTNGRVALRQDEGEVATFAFQGSDFDQERALMLIELYRKAGIWRLAISGQGFNGGLDALVRHFGGEVANEVAAPPAAVSLEKRIAREAPHLLSLAKKAAVSLEKQGLQTTVARVGLVLDASGSMRRQYKSGRVQELLDRVLPLALHFDNDGQLDVWAFDRVAKPLPPATTRNIQGYVDTANGGWKRWYGGANDEPAVMRAVIDAYRREPKAPPAYVLFVSDGGVHQNREIKALMTEAAHHPIFWQFMGLGGRNYGILERLDTMAGRIVDNCGFFAIDDLHSLTEEQLYDRMLQEFPAWLRNAGAKGIIR